MLNSKQMKVSTLFLMLMLSARMLMAQQTITGTVISEDDKQPIPGASVKISNSTTATITDINGKFSIKAKSTDVLRVSFIGFNTKSIAIGNQRNITITLTAAVTALNEVAVVGYGTQKKINLTGSIQTLRLDSAVNTPVTNSAQLMYGKFSGVQLTQSSGLAGDDASSINIRGLGTFGNSTPLVVIDGIQYETLDQFNRLAPSDIESITVLKDASAGAIYGARGANGVILINTKQGNSDSFKVEYNNYVGKQSATVLPKFLNAIQYATLENEKWKNLADGGSFNPRYTDEQIQKIIDGSDPYKFANTDWVKATMQSATVQNHFLALSGGRGTTKFRISANYLSQDAIVRGDYNTDRYNFRINLNSDLKKWLTIGNNLTTTYTKIKAPTGGLGTANDIMSSFSRNAPTIPLYNADGRPGFSDGALGNINPSFGVEYNFVRYGNNGDYTNNNFDLNNRTFFRVNFLKNLSLESSLALNGIFTNTSDFKPTNIDQGDQAVTTTINKLINTSNYNYIIQAENILRYNAKYKQNNFSFLAGYSTYYTSFSTFNASLSNFPNNAIQVLDGGGTLNPTVGGNRSNSALQSFFGRMTYNFKDKYLFEFNIRRDASSKFSPETRYGYFPSLSAGWRVSEEKFMRDIIAKDILSSLKIRGSWGRVGNNGIPTYGYAQTYNAGLDYVLGTANSIVSGAAITTLANPTMKWETTEQYDLGLDASFLKNKLSLEADYFRRKSYDVLYTNFPLPSTLGVTSLVAQNSAAVLNSGVELNINYTQKSKKGISYNIGANVTKNAKNKVTSLGIGTPAISTFNIINQGIPYNAYYGWKAIGIFQSAAEVASSPQQFGITRTAPGDIKYADLSGPDGTPDGKIDSYDRTVIGNPYPIWLYGLSSSASYKGISLSFNLQGVAKVDRLLKSGGREPLTGDRDNGLEYWVNRWTPDNPSTTLPRLGGANNDISSTFYVNDASYLRLKNVELGYDIPKKFLKKMNISGLRFFISGQNLVTFTKLKYFDPERSVATTTATSTGSSVASTRYVPLYKVYTAGLNFTL
ncbi:TonB-dependent receptor [Pelobium sp.]|nr:TonB-dependent receptor [Pelobium sp.]MDA9555545.1 TonB-dependent receptor [Pelobium sp.]